MLSPLEPSFNVQLSPALFDWLPPAGKSKLSLKNTIWLCALNEDKMRKNVKIEKRILI
jgi:hypothetical protein